jgi:cytochrome c-type biogenesis protein CcmH
MMKNKTNFLFLFILLFVLFSISLTFLPSGKVFAQQPTPSDDNVNAIASQLFCPVCQNTPLDVCPTTACHQWRELIRQMLAEGKTAAEIKQYFVSYYGASVLAEPPRSGFNWLIYIVPPIAFLLGVFLLFQAFRTWKQKTSAPVTSPGKMDSPPSDKSVAPKVDDPYLARLEDELKKRR